MNQVAERDERLKSIPPEVWAKMSPEDREKSLTDYYEAQESRDGAGSLKAGAEGAELARRIAAGELTHEQVDQMLDEELGRIGD